MQIHLLIRHITSSEKVQEPYKWVCPNTASFLSRGQPIWFLESEKFYFESSETEIADFDVQIIINENVVTLDVPVDYAQLMHVLEHSG